MVWRWFSTNATEMSRFRRLGSDRKADVANNKRAIHENPDIYHVVLDTGSILLYTTDDGEIHVWIDESIIDG